MKVNLKVLNKTRLESHPVEGTEEYTVNVNVTSQLGRILGGKTKVLKNKHGVFFDSDFQSSVSFQEKMTRKREIMPLIQKEALGVIAEYDTETK